MKFNGFNEGSPSFVVNYLSIVFCCKFLNNIRNIYLLNANASALFDYPLSRHSYVTPKSQIGWKIRQLWANEGRKSEKLDQSYMNIIEIGCWLWWTARTYKIDILVGCGTKYQMSRSPEHKHRLGSTDFAQINWEIGPYLITFL